MDDPSYYGFPTYGEATVKAAEDCGGAVVTGDDRTFEPDPERLARLADFMASTFPGSGRPVRSKTCLYTLTNDRDFLIGPVPGPRQRAGRRRCRSQLQVRADDRPDAGRGRRDR